MKFGRRAIRMTKHTLIRARLFSLRIDALGAAPAVSNDYVAAVDKQTGTSWGMMMNDTLGCCVAADSGHEVMLHTANTGSIIIPSDADILSLYEAVGGYVQGDPSTDNGCDETSMCQYMESTGLDGHKSEGTAMIDVTNIDHIKWTMQLFGACRLGINVPDYFMTQFNAGQVWDVEGDPTTANIVGGHDVPIVKYDGSLFYVVTWGKLQGMTPAAFAAFTEEAHAELYLDWMDTAGTAPSGFNADQLASDLQALTKAA